jgi:hypothetical protein
VTTLLLLKVDVSIVAFPRLQFDFDYAADLQIGVRTAVMDGIRLELQDREHRAFEWP